MYNDGITTARVARTGLSVPGVGGSIVYSTIDNSPRLRDNGQIAFITFMNNSDTMEPAGSAIIRGLGTAVTKMVQSGEAAPGGGSYQAFDQIQHNNNGVTSFMAFNGTGRAIYRGIPGNISRIAGEGDSVINSPDPIGFLIASGLETLDMNDSGSIAFTDTGSDYSNIYSDRSGILEVIYRGGLNGDIAPGTNGLTFSNLFFSNINNNGRIAFHAFLETGNFDRGIWAEDSSGQLQLVARVGDLFEVSPGVI